MKAFQAFTLTICLAGMLAAAGAQARPTAMCPMIYKPVCAAKHGHHKTYANSCIARAADADILHDGKCHSRH
jgi:hypothetical protein